MLHIRGGCQGKIIYQSWNWLYKKPASRIYKISWQYTGERQTEFKIPNRNPVLSKILASFSIWSFTEVCAVIPVMEENYPKIRGRKIGRWKWISINNKTDEIQSHAIISSREKSHARQSLYFIIIFDIILDYIEDTPSRGSRASTRGRWRKLHIRYRKRHLKRLFQSR